MNLWALTVLLSIGCYAFKLGGALVPAWVLERGAVRRVVELLPVALLSALVVVELLADGRHYDVDGARLAGLGVGALAVWRKLPFLVVIVAAAATAALLRLL
jgi:branched-subunit amino acid transport protein